MYNSERFVYTPSRYRLTVISEIVTRYRQGSSHPFGPSLFMKSTIARTASCTRFERLWLPCWISTFSAPPIASHNLNTSGQDLLEEELNHRTSEMFKNSVSREEASTQMGKSTLELEERKHQYKSTHSSWDRTEEFQNKHSAIKCTSDLSFIKSGHDHWRLLKRLTKSFWNSVTPVYSYKVVYMNCVETLNKWNLTSWRSSLTALQGLSYPRSLEHTRPS